VGTEYQKERTEEGSQVENRFYLFDFGMTYGVTERTSISVAIPFVIAQRSQLNSDLDMRNETSARGIGDLTVTARRWMFDPKQYLDQNVQLGFGLKFPTGSPNATDTFLVDKDDDGEYDSGTDNEVRTADQSIQPGDGGFGFLVDINAYKQLGRFVPYFAGTYLFNPEETNGVKTWRGRQPEAIMSIADQYVARSGVLWSTGVEGLSVGFGLRMEGVPVHDLLGGSDGFRRPGYAVSWDPSLVYATQRGTFTLSVPWAEKRNRQKSVPDAQDEDPDRHGDAAFADWLLLFGWSYRF